MRVVHLCADPGVPVFGTKGSSVHVQEVVRAFRRLGHEVVIVAARTGGRPPADLADVEVHRLADISHDDTSIGRETARRDAGRRCGEALERCGDVELVYERYSLWGASAMTWAAANDAIGILEVNAPLPDEHARHRTLHDPAAAEEVARVAIGAADRVVAVSEPVASWCRERTSGRCDRVVVVPNGVDTERIRPRAGTPRQWDEARSLTVGFVGTLKPWHGVDVLAAAFETLAPPERWHLLVVGDGPERDAVAERLAPVADRVEFTGPVAHAAVPRLLERMDLAVAPYPPTADYFSPLKLYEYLAAGLPTVASDVPAIRHGIGSADVVELVPAGDRVELARALLRLGADVVRRSDLARRGRDHVVRHHTWIAVADQILDGVGHEGGAITSGLAAQAGGVG